MTAHTPEADSRYRQRLELHNDPAYTAMRQKLSEARAEVRRLRSEVKYQKARAELWRLRALRKGKR